MGRNKGAHLTPEHRRRMGAAHRKKTLEPLAFRKFLVEMPNIAIDKLDALADHHLTTRSFEVFQLVSKASEIENIYPLVKIYEFYNISLVAHGQEPVSQETIGEALLRAIKSLRKNDTGSYELPDGKIDNETNTQ
ncbi:hypothetical protein MUP77_24660 [Candidatus Bathyarchaeota archaeon]|nr:hypothetical protein [Candidatus Bathyarchaeota archaeon]